MNIAVDLPCGFSHGNPEIVRSLKVHPELRSIPEIAPESEGRISGDTALAIDDLTYAVHRDPQVACELIDADPQRFHEVLEQDLSRVNQWLLRVLAGLSRHGLAPSVVVHNLDFIGITLPPDKADAKSVVDSDAMLAFAVSFQGFQTVAGENREILQLVRRVELFQFPLDNSCAHSVPSWNPSFKERFRILVAQGSNHL
jgi:hypothetical protein